MLCPAYPEALQRMQPGDVDDPRAARRREAQGAGDGGAGPVVEVPHAAPRPPLPVGELGQAPEARAERRRHRCSGDALVARLCVVAEAVAEANPRVG